MGLTAGSGNLKSKGRKRKVHHIARLPLEERTTKEQERLMQIAIMQKSGIKKIEIAKQLEITPQTVSKYLKKVATYYPNLKDVDAYRINKESLIQAVESQALQSIANSLQNSAPNVRDASLAFRTLHQASRLESGQSTQNINNHVQFSSTPLADVKSLKYLK